MIPPLTSYQESFLARNEKRALLVHSTGCFKSRTAIEWARKWGGDTLIVCPKGLKENWKRELQKWVGNDFLKSFAICSKEEFKLRHPRRYRNLIVDEADHFFSPGHKSALAKSLRDYLKANDPNLCMLSATPMRSSPWNVYVASTFLDKRWNYKDFQYAFFQPVYFGSRMIWQSRKDDASKARLRAAVKKIADVVRREDYFEIPEQSYETVYINEDHTQKELKKQNIETAAIARFTADHRAEAMNRNKFDAVVRLAEENTALAVVCRYHEQMDALRAVLNEKGHVVGEVSGRKSAEERQKAIDMVNTQGGVLLIQSSTVEGYELPNVRVMVFASMSYSYRDRVQAEGRILRMNAIAKNAYITLVSGDADEAILKAITNKEDFDPLRYDRS